LQALAGGFKGEFVYTGVARLVFVHHVSVHLPFLSFEEIILTYLPQSTLCVNSLVHWLGETPFDDKHTPRDHMVTALLAIRTGHHNFYHQLPESDQAVSI